MHKPIKYVEKGLSIAANGAWMVFSNLNNVTPFDSTNGADGEYKFTGTLIGSALLAAVVQRVPFGAHLIGSARRPLPAWAAEAGS